MCIRDSPQTEPSTKKNCPDNPSSRTPSSDFSFAPTESELAAAPEPGKANNITKGRDDSPNVFKTLVPHVLFFIPKWTFAAIMWPIREGLYSLDRYDLAGKVGALLSGDAPITLYPSAIVVAGQGVTLGFGVEYKKYIRGRFLFGGEARRIFAGRVRTRDLLGSSFELDAEIEHQRLRNTIFAGIGNGALQSGPLSSPLIDPLTDETAFETRFDQNVTRIEVGANLSIIKHLQLRFSGAYLRRRFDEDGPDDTSSIPLQDFYDTTNLVAFNSGFDQAYGELRFIFDNRIQPSPWMSTALPTRGWKVTGFGGRTHSINDNHEDYTRLGLDVQRYQHLFGGNRILIIRTQTEWVSAGVGEIPFVDLAQPAGSIILRGYRRGRFRDRMSLLNSLEYRFPINRQISGFLFLDAGTVARTPGELDIGNLHYGTGIGLHVHTADRLLIRLQAAGGEDGLVFNASFKSSDRVRKTTKRR